MEAGDPTDSLKDACLEDQRALRVPSALDDPNAEVRQPLQKPSGPATVGEVIQRQVASSNPEVEPLPFGVFSDANPTIKVGAIILMDGVTIDAAEPTVGVSQPLGDSLDIPACLFNAQSIANGVRRRCSQCCRRRTRPRSRPHFAGQGAHSQTSGHGRQAALSCFSVRGRCCRQSGWGLAQLRPTCAD